MSAAGSEATEGVDGGERLSARSRAFGTYQQEEDKLNLEGDLYTYAFVAALEPPYSSRKGSATAKFFEVVGPLMAMLAVSLIQILMGWAVYLHVLNDMIHTHTRPLHTAYEMFVGSNITVPLHTVEDLCGQWEDQEMKDFAQGPLSTMKMPDGTLYSPDESYSLFYNLKQPTRTWDYGRLGTERSVLDDIMFVISEGVSLNPFTPSGYSLLFVATLAMFFFSIFSEFRDISRFGGMLVNLEIVPSTVARRELVTRIWSYDKDSEVFSLVGQTSRARLVGMVTVLSRSIVACYLLGLGTIFLLFTTLKIDLILNGLALVFLLELDKIVYMGSVTATTQKFIDDIAPVVYRKPPANTIPGEADRASSWGPVFMFPGVFAAALLARYWQVTTFKRYFRMVSAICLFAGPTQPFARTDVIQPVAGFCDSLLGVSCAPLVEPESALKKHGYCVITDQTTISRPSIQMYLDDPTLFANRFNSDGSQKSWVEWGEANPRLYQSKRWMKGPYQDLLRKQCLSMYQRTVPPDDVMVDDDVGETMDGAPFLCAREPLFKAVFGDVAATVDKTNLLGPIVRDRHEGGLTHIAMEQVKPLDHPDVVKAIDACRNSKVLPPTPAPPKEAAPAPAPEEPEEHAEETPPASEFHLLNKHPAPPAAAPPHHGGQKLRARRQRHTHGHRHKKHHNGHHHHHHHADADAADDA